MEKCGGNATVMNMAARFCKLFALSLHNGCSATAQQLQRYCKAVAALLQV
ncbi:MULTISPECIES: hypothetical protein [Bacteroides]|jgi:hypothetical protein|uniref:Uncharacterized protein n=1 Tax=Bacteroides muris (ex Fokt et al. 2023) TaxID=2937417 RepID=A0A9X2NM25_9BACE|nr:MULTISPECIES: hypothetical protein [Bacteroides]MCR6503273.1 hypothetical protein [Bacteroides muris (ex Fokt et al. 2023)]MCR6508588.1 hypothetical protein [Bacteroides muris (ex Fokt et al. 2023)]